ncbi:unnamed protein product [Caenorhabditis sp. 36 PRJEB53466]|nr:unnamed protein product [Caenorhabditis sp. 36 PRJEB53466]
MAEPMQTSETIDPDLVMDPVVPSLPLRVVRKIALRCDHQTRKTLRACSTLAKEHFDKLPHHYFKIEVYFYTDCVQMYLTTYNMKTVILNFFNEVSDGITTGVRTYRFSQEYDYTHKKPGKDCLVMAIDELKLIFRKENLKIDLLTIEPRNKAYHKGLLLWECKGDIEKTLPPNPIETVYLGLRTILSSLGRLVKVRCFDFQFDRKKMLLVFLPFFEAGYLRQLCLRTTLDYPRLEAIFEMEQVRKLKTLQLPNTEVPVKKLYCFPGFSVTSRVPSKEQMQRVIQKLHQAPSFDHCFLYWPAGSVVDYVALFGSAGTEYIAGGQYYEFVGEQYTMAAIANVDNIKFRRI